MRRAKLGPDLTQMESEEVQAIFSSKDDPASRLHGLSARIFSQTMSISMDLVEQSRTINNRTMPPDKQSQDYKSAAERKELDLQQVQGELKAVQARCNKYIDLIRDNIQVECMKRPYTTNIKKWLAIAEECAGNGNDFLGMRIKGVMSELFDRSPEHKGILDASKIYKMLTNPNEGYFASSLFSGRYKA